MEIIEKIIRFINTILDYIYKKRCYFCGKSKEAVKMCSKCYNELCFSNYRANRQVLGIDIYVAGLYEKTLQKMIRGIKYHHQKELAYYQAKFMWEYFQEVLKEKEIANDFQVVPVPLHKTRERERGYNQMKLVAEEFCKLSGYEPNYELVKRVKKTKAQYKLTRQERLKNLSKAFMVDKSKFIEGKTVLLIDDICTTGSTFESMISELKSAGINNILCLATSSPH